MGKDELLIITVNYEIDRPHRIHHVVEFMAKHWNLTVLSRSYQSPDGVYQRGGIIEHQDKMEYIQVACAGHPFGFSIAQHAWEFIRTIRKLGRKFRVAVAGDPISGLAAAILTREGLLGSFLYEDIDYFPGFYPEGAGRRIVEYAEAVSLESATSIVCVSKLLAELRVEQGIQAERITILPNGAGVSKKYAAEDKSGIFTAAGLDGRDNLIAYFGILDESSGGELLLDLGRKLPGIGARLVVGGKGPLAGRFSQDPDIIFLGWVESRLLPSILSRCKIGLIPFSGNPSTAQYYACPLKLYDYTSCGLPVVAGNEGETARIVTHHFLGIATSLQTGSFLHAVNRLLQDPVLYREHQNAAREFSRKHSWEQVLSREGDLVQELFLRSGT
ncbi:hypothetical protein MTAT_09870 [Moorella thermoacetica]|uniref:Glycosyl transferase n=1 Tax=Neomoorella thermoacetica TaxID=1525 RepID=A0AAC9HGL2_NEOTH|nr:glycosyltransferase [Moorella thermoacetica]AOQ23407.1 putative glycosyl transferase [Moorella thermoacetica]TYL13591.1 hypothetical protein MTAT_09870 [Moorella thermoacetica]